MQGRSYRRIYLNVCVAAASFCLCALNGHGQDGGRLAPSSSPSPEISSEVRALSDLVRDLQIQVQALNSQLTELRAEQQSGKEETRELRRQLDNVNAQAVPPKNGPETSRAALSANPSIEYPPAPLASGNPQETGTPGRLAKLEENQEIIEAKVNDQYQTKIESGSKYRLRLSGIALLNLYDNRGLVDNQDYPALAIPPASEPLFVSPSSFGGSLRQSQVRLQAFGPDIAGAKTSADIEFDFAGGFSSVPNGTTMSLVRLRTGTLRLDWTNTSIVAGQGRLFFAPLSPTSLATLAIPALSYAGNLWAWTPQVRIEHRVALSDASSLLFQGGILDSLTGDFPVEDYSRYPSWGEESGQPVYATRIAWSHRAFGQNLIFGAGGYYGRQNWGFNRTIDGWAGTVDVTVPIGKQFEFTGAFYRGRGAAGFGGGIGQPVLLNGSFIDPATTFRGLDSMGGWAQLKFKFKPNFEINGALGMDNPYAGELRQYNTTSIYGTSYTRNLSPMANFIYQLRSDVLISTEYRWLKTSILDSGSNHASHINLSLGYLF